MTKGEQIRAKIVEVMREGRANPSYLRDRIDELDDAQDVQSHLRTLATRGRVRKVARGLYELDPGEQHETEMPAHATIDDSPSTAGDDE